MGACNWLPHGLHASDRSRSSSAVLHSQVMFVLRSVLVCACPEVAHHFMHYLQLMQSTVWTVCTGGLWLKFFCIAKNSTKSILNVKRSSDWPLRFSRNDHFMVVGCYAGQVENNSDDLLWQKQISKKKKSKKERLWYNSWQAKLRAFLKSKVFLSRNIDL